MRRRRRAEAFRTLTQVALASNKKSPALRRATAISFECVLCAGGSLVSLVVRLLGVFVGQLAMMLGGLCVVLRVFVLVPRMVVGGLVMMMRGGVVVGGRLMVMFTGRMWSLRH
jgi:hypothetical protein